MSKFYIVIELSEGIYLEFINSLEHTFRGTEELIKAKFYNDRASALQDIEEKIKFGKLKTIEIKEAL